MDKTYKNEQKKKEKEKVFSSDLQLLWSSEIPETWYLLLE